MSIQPLEQYELINKTALESVGYELSSDLDTGKYDVIGQPRAMQAIEFGLGMSRHNYNLYLCGSTGLGKHSLIRYVLEQDTSQKPMPYDWCYVDNFEAFYKPLVLKLPAGMGNQLRSDMQNLVEELLIAIPSAYESMQYRTQAQEIEESEEERRELAFQELADRANRQNITLMQTPVGYTLVPSLNGRPMDKKELDKLDESQQQAIQSKIDNLKADLKALILKIPEWQKEARDTFKDLNTHFAKATIRQYLDPLLEKYRDVAEANGYLRRVRDDIVLNIHYFITRNMGQGLIEGQTVPIPPELARYEVNVLVDNSQTKSAPVVYENNPNYNNLLGRIEHVAQEGALITDFTLIKQGALHRANGGYLILDVDKLLMNPFSWEGLKRVLYAREIRMESLERMLSLVSTVSLEPEPIPLDVKVILLGDRTLYYLLKFYDPEFSALFKVTADFSETFDRDPESVRQMALIIAAIANREKTRPLQKDAVARILDQSARDTGDAGKFSLHMGQLKDLVLESDYWAGKTGEKKISREAVQKAIAARIHRADQIRELEREDILRGQILIDTDGAKSGQVNGLSVISLGDYSFGQPSRITATARLGNGSVVDIERETKMGGPIHSKAVMILSSCLANRYARNRPFSLHATLVFEQNYAGVEGDSASIAEYCALVSALTDLPVQQNLAVTGSINQHGVVQPIGGVNQKIEGFYDICQSRGLNGQQGVIIPSANRRHLMLRDDVIQSVAAGQFHIYTVDNVDDALELLLNRPAGSMGADGTYSEDTVSYRVMQRLDELQRLHRLYGKTSDDQKDNEEQVNHDKDAS